VTVRIDAVIHYEEDCWMKPLLRSATVVAILSALLLAPIRAQTNPQAAKAAPAPVHAIGSFDVKIAPQDDKTDPAIARYVLDKQFLGDLEATSKGEMLSTGGAKGTGGYVAIEIVTGTLNGRTGTFALQHIGSMIDNAFTLDVNVVPGSGTGQVAGITGKMKIIIAPGGKHSYDFEYTLPAAAK
jgi:hypothetical protein